MRKITFKLILVIFLCLVIAACSDKTSKDSNDGNGNGDERVTLELATNEHASWPTDEDWLVWKLMEDGGDVNFDINIAADPYDESLNLMMASGNPPDIIGMQNQTVANRYGEDGALINILDHIDQMPNLQEWMKQYPEESRRALSHDGKMYIGPSEGIGETERRLWLYRKDIFDKHDLETPDNWDELYTTLKELKELYPDSYPLGYRNGTDKNINLAVNFGTHHAYYYDFDEEEWRYGPTEDNYRALVEYLKKFYDDGLIPPDFLSIDTEGWQKLMTTEASFITQDYIGRIDSFNDQMRTENPDYNLINMPPPAGFPDGEQLDYSSHVWMRGFSISRDTEHLDDVLRFLDWTYSEEGRDTLSWGIEGETYTIEDGEKAWIEDYDSPADSRSDTGISLFSTYSWFDYDSHMVLFSDEVKQAYEEDPQYDAPVVPTPAFTKDEQEKIAIEGEAITKHRDEEIAKFIIGKRDLSEWDDYVDEMENLGLEEMINVYAEAHQRMLDVDLE